MENKTRFPYAYFVVTFLWSWLIWLPFVLAGAGIIQLDGSVVKIASIPAIAIGAFGPAVGALYCLNRYQGKHAIREYLSGLLEFRLGWKAWLIPILVLGGSTWLAWILPELWGEPRLEMLLPSAWVFPIWVLLMIFLGGGQEELGWRGYILDPLEERLGQWLGSLLLGLVWACWHLPLFFIPGASQTYMPFAGFVLLMVGYSWFFSWVREVSGKRLLAGLFAHGISNAFVPLFPTLVMVSGAAQPRFWIWVGLTFVIGLATMALRSLEDRRASHR